MFLMPSSRAKARWRSYAAPPPYQIGASVSSNNLIVTLSQARGAPAPLLEFRNPAVANGDPFYRLITNTQFLVSSGNTFGTASSNVPFRLWAVGFDNGAGVSLGLFQSVTGGSSPTAIAALDETSVQSPAGGNGGSSAGTFYCAQGLTNRPFRVLAFLEWSSGLATAGTWASSPTKIQLFGPGIRKPGDIVQATQVINVGSGTNNSASFADVSGATLNITPTSAVNLIRYHVIYNNSASAGGAGTNSQGQVKLVRGSTTIGTTQVQGTVSGSGTNVQSQDNGSFAGLDFPQSTSAQTYKLQQSYVSAGTGTTTTTGANILLEEIMC